jgi:hypothetical protein
MPGPKRQLTPTSFANTVGTEGVDVEVGGGVFVDKGVCVGNSVGGGDVLDGSKTTVGVSVTGTFDGRLQASVVKMRAMSIPDI